MKVSPGCISEAAAKEFGHPVDRELLGDVDELAAAVIALPRQALGIFVGQDGALRFQHGAAHDVLGRDQLDLVALPAKFQVDRLRHFPVGFGQRGLEKAVGLGRRRGIIG
jgi:hypothetical protein